MKPETGCNAQALKLSQASFFKHVSSTDLLLLHRLLDWLWDDHLQLFQRPYFLGAAALFEQRSVCRVAAAHAAFSEHFNN